jgi:hypothetical protein
MPLLNLVKQKSLLLHKVSEWNRLRLMGKTKQKEEQTHPRTKRLIAELRKWCDQKYGRRSEMARLLGVPVSLFHNWLSIPPHRTPDLDQGFAIEDFLKKQRKGKKK